MNTVRTGDRSVVPPKAEKSCRPSKTDAASRHGGDVERGPHPERLALAKRAARPVPDGVAVLPVPRRIAGLEPVGCPPEVADRDVRREQGVDRPLEPAPGDLARVGEGDHLAAGVDPGIRASRPVDRHPLAPVEAGQRGLELSLDRPGVALQLEPGEVRSVVFDRRAVAHGEPSRTRSQRELARPARSGRFRRRRPCAGRCARAGCTRRCGRRTWGRSRRTAWR